MEKIVTQDVWIPVEKETKYAIRKWDAKAGEWTIKQNAEKLENMVVLTKEQYEADKRKTAEDAFEWGMRYGMDLIHSAENGDDPTLLNKEEYLTQLFGEGKYK
jgi:hypothetical protein